MTKLTCLSGDSSALVSIWLDRTPSSSTMPGPFHAPLDKAGSPNSTAAVTTTYQKGL